MKGPRAPLACASRRPRARGVLAAFLILGALLLVGLPAGGVARVPPPSPSPTLQAAGDSWAWSGERILNGNGSAYSPVLGPYTYLFHGLFGSAEVLNQTSGGNGTLQVTGFGVLGTLYYVTICAPDCQAPQLTANISAFGYLRQQGVANLTEEGSVLEPHGPAPALALSGSEGTTRGNVTRLYQWRGSGPFYGRSGFQYLSDAVESTEGIHFQPALGVIPAALAPGLDWGASAHYQSTGQFVTGGHKYSTNSGSQGLLGTGRLDHQGNLSLTGSSSGNYSLGRAGRGPRLSLDFGNALGLGSGPFGLFPSTSLFLGFHAPWSPNASTPAITGPSRLDWSLNARHLGTVGAETNYTATNLSTPSLSGRTAPSYPSGPSVGPTNVEAAPASVSGALDLMAALLSPPALGPPSYRASSLPLVGLVVAAGVVAVGLLLAAPRWGLPPRVPEASEGYQAFRVPPSDPRVPARRTPPHPSASEPSSESQEADPLSSLL